MKLVQPAIAVAEMPGQHRYASAQASPQCRKEYHPYSRSYAIARIQIFVLNRARNQITTFDSPRAVASKQEQI